MCLEGGNSTPRTRKRTRSVFQCPCVRPFLFVMRLEQRGIRLSLSLSALKGLVCVCGVGL